MAAVSRRYGPPDVVRVADVPRPEPGDDEILVRVIRELAEASALVPVVGACYP